MKVFEECQPHIKSGSSGPNRPSHFGLVALHEHSTRLARAVKSFGLEESEGGSLHEKPADIRFRLAQCELIEINARNPICSCNENIRRMKITV